MTQITIPREVVEQLVGALEQEASIYEADNADGAPESMYGAIRAGRAALANVEPVSQWIAVSDRLPIEVDGEVLVRMRDGRPEIAWATYWHGADTGFAQWTFRDPDEDETPTHWMPLPKDKP